MGRDQKPAKAHIQTRARGKVLTSRSNPSREADAASLDVGPADKPSLSLGLVATYWIACAIGGAGAAFAMFSLKGGL